MGCTAIAGAGNFDTPRQADIVVGQGVPLLHTVNLKEFGTIVVTRHHQDERYSLLNG
jgi:hypothetical protein